jgi:hypothetical protein
MRGGKKLGVLEEDVELPFDFRKATDIPFDFPKATDI